MESDVLWLRYVDDVLVVVPQSMDLAEKLNELNLVDPQIQFTIEKERQGVLPFLDTEIIRSKNRLKFKVYRKPTNREDYVDFFSGHSERVKRGIVLGFFLRALRICSQEFLDDEIQHIISSFLKLKCPKGLLLSLKKKSVAIRNRTSKEKSRKKDIRFISIPNSKAAESIVNELETAGIKIAVTSGKKIGGMLTEKKGSDYQDFSVVYKVPCGSCDKSYIGETGRGINIRIKEHKRDLRNDMDYSAFVVHAHETHHLLKWEEATVLASCKNKGNRKATEAAYIATNDTINTRVGFIKWAKSAAVLASRRIKYRLTYVLICHLPLYTVSRLTCTIL